MKKYITLFALTALAVMTVYAEKPAPTPGQMPQPPGKHKPMHRKSPDAFRRGPGLWKAFSLLSSAEKQELLKLQRTDPDKFRTELQKKADELYQKERERKRKLHTLAQQYRQETDKAKKELIRTKLRTMVKEDMTRKLARMRDGIEESKKRIARMEVSLQKREKNLEKITDTITDHIISGKKYSRKKNPPVKAR